jgi:transposase-like protein
MKAIGMVARQQCGRWFNNRAEQSHQPFRRREGAMAKIRTIKIWSSKTKRGLGVCRRQRCHRVQVSP